MRRCGFLRMPGDPDRVGRRLSVGRFGRRVRQLSAYRVQRLLQGRQPAITQCGGARDRNRVLAQLGIDLGDPVGGRRALDFVEGGQLGGELRLGGQCPRGDQLLDRRP